ncbi:hypothetical protein D3C80_1732410 [compost metagenome]
MQPVPVMLHNLLRADRRHNKVMGEKSAPLPRKISRQIAALPNYGIVRLRMEQMQRSWINLLILLAACRKLSRSIVDAEGVENFFDKIIIKTVRFRYGIEALG